MSQKKSSLKRRNDSSSHDVPWTIPNTPNFPPRTTNIISDEKKYMDNPHRTVDWDKGARQLLSSEEYLIIAMELDWDGIPPSVYSKARDEVGDEGRSIGKLLIEKYKEKKQKPEDDVIRLSNLELMVLAWLVHAAQDRDRHKYPVINILKPERKSSGEMTDLFK